MRMVRGTLAACHVVTAKFGEVSVKLYVSVAMKLVPLPVGAAEKVAETLVLPCTPVTAMSPPEGMVTGAA